MRKFPFLVMAAIALSVFFVTCKTKKETSKTTTTETVSVTPKPDLFTVASKKYPGITQGDLDAGKAIFTGDCTRCHGSSAIESRTEYEWMSIIDHMAPKANLTADQKSKLVKYVCSQRASSN